VSLLVRAGLGAALGGLVLGGVVACSSADAGGGCAGAPAGQSYVSPDGAIRLIPVHCRVPAPDIRGHTLGGATYDVATDLGHVVVIPFWGSWCGPCRKDQATLNAVYAATSRLGVRFVGVDVQDDTDAAQAFRRTHDVAYDSVVDRYDDIAVSFDPRLPTVPPVTVVIDKQGRLAARLIGSAPRAVLQPIVTQVAAEKP
jgi:thiol-disulfide isomerase/thioredoxin